MLTVLGLALAAMVASLPPHARAAVARAVVGLWVRQLRLWDALLRDHQPWLRPEDD